MTQWLVVGISGVTNAGKTTLATNLYYFFKQHEQQQILTSNYILNEVVLISQDDYFLENSDPRHEIVEQLNHVNYEIITALDIDRMLNDIGSILKDEKYLYQAAQTEATSFQKKLNILLVEGFLIFNHQNLIEIFSLKFHIHLPYEKVYERRLLRVYDPPDIVGYFEMCVWPWYEKHFSEFKDRKDIFMLNGDLPKERLFKFVLNCLNEIL